MRGVAPSVALLAIIVGGAPHLARGTIGDGLTLPGGVWVAGDVTTEVQAPHHGPALAEIDDVSLLARVEPTPRLAFFAELRLDELVHVVEGDGLDTGDVDLALERLYAESLLTPELTLRLGKVFTPFGLWNAIHRAPLAWTAEEPAVADDVFPVHATGLSLLYQTTWHGWSLDATAYGPAQDAVPVKKPEDEGWLAGSRVAAGHRVGRAFATLGVSAAGFRDYTRATWHTATGLDLDVSLGGHLVSGELVFRLPEAGGRPAQGFYLQDVIALAPLAPWARDLYGVVRLEHFQPRRGSGAVGGLVGLFWRPRPWLVLRADHLAASQPLERLTPGLHASLSLLF